MTASKIKAPTPAVALGLHDAAAALGMSPSSFERYVKADVRLIRRGSLVLVPVAELTKWVGANAEHIREAT